MTKQQLIEEARRMEQGYLAVIEQQAAALAAVCKDDSANEPSSPRIDDDFGVDDGVDV